MGPEEVGRSKQAQARTSTMPGIIAGWSWIVRLEYLEVQVHRGRDQPQGEGSGQFLGGTMVDPASIWSSGALATSRTDRLDFSSILFWHRTPTKEARDLRIPVPTLLMFLGLIALAGLLAMAFEPPARRLVAAEHAALGACARDVSTSVRSRRRSLTRSRRRGSVR